jgi:hypothetical protein
VSTGDDLDDIVLLEGLGSGLLVRRDGREVLENVVDREGGRERDACAREARQRGSQMLKRSGLDRAAAFRTAWSAGLGLCPAYRANPSCFPPVAFPLSAVASEGTTRRGKRGEELTLGSTLGLVVERLDALLDELVTLLAELENVGALDRLGDELLDDLFDDAGGGLVLVKGRGRD